MTQLFKSLLFNQVLTYFCLGDFNIDLMNPINPLISLFENYNLVQITDEPIRISDTKNNLIEFLLQIDP